MAIFIGGRMDVTRIVSCICGWTARFSRLKTATAALEIHLAEGVEGCDHAVAITDGE